MRYFGWRPYVPVDQRRRNAERETAKLAKKGHPVSPVIIEGHDIARTFWGQSWCQNLERYSDFSNRLPRGRSYVRNGLVVDLQIAAGEVKARVSGSEMYDIVVRVSALPRPRWTSLCTDCVGAIDSLVELLQARLSKGVMERLCRAEAGLFPSPKEISLSCSCPDYASMCKHVAAVLYGIGARLDERPELLFTLRKVDEKDLVAKAARGLPLSKKGPARDKVLAGDDLSELFGLDMGAGTESIDPKGSPTKRARAPKAAVVPEGSSNAAKKRRGGRRESSSARKASTTRSTKSRGAAKH